MINQALQTSCTSCGRPLRSLASIQAGMGPICRGKITTLPALSAAGQTLPRYDVVEITPEYILLRDLGPWDVYPTITNAAEAVVQELAPKIAGRKLFYIDSEAIVSRLLVEGGHFKGFKSEAPPVSAKEVK